MLVPDGRALNAYPPARIHALPYDTTAQHERMLEVAIRQIALNRRERREQKSNLSFSTFKGTDDFR